MDDPLRIGVSGHRFLSEIDRLRQSIDAGLKQLAESFPGWPFLVLSALAEGADRLVAGRVLEWTGAKLTAVLPMPKESYLTDFLAPESKAEFLNFLIQATEIVELPPKPDRNQSYEAAGQYIVDHCDVLFALWDGDDAQGRGGTGAIVGRARALGLPLAWIHAGNRAPGGTEPTSLGTEQGALTFERMDRISRSR
jgi:hypothetical protein